MKRVSYIFPTSHHYRRPFHERLRLLLADQGVDYRVVYSAPSGENISKKDTVEIDWGFKVPVTQIAGLKYQHALIELLKSDLVIIQQENSLVLNYFANFLSMCRLKKVAYFGHGRNFQSRNFNSLPEIWKRFWAGKVDWWFGYTDETRRHIESLGFPRERITVFNNAVDSSSVRSTVSAVTDEDLRKRREELGLIGSHVGIFVGGLYSEKRLEFLVKSAEKVKAVVPNFEMIIIGGGDDMAKLMQLVADKPWIKVTGPKFGSEKVELMMLGSLFLMPGLVGLAVLDAGAAGLPTVTTAFPWHSPEIAYIEDGVNGVIVPEWEDENSYASAVSALLLDSEKLDSLRQRMMATSESINIDMMALRFSKGVLEAISIK